MKIMYQKGIVPIVIILLIAAVIGGYLIYQKQFKSTPSAKYQQTTQSSVSPTSKASVTKPASPNPSSAQTSIDQTDNWLIYEDSKYPLSFKYPTDWLVNSKDEQGYDQRIISLAKKDTPTTVSLSFSILPSWNNTGNAKDLIKNIVVGGEQGVRVDPPTKSEANLERYQTNFYIEHAGKVYFFGCVHNWNQDYLNTCNSIIKTVKFTN